MATALKKSDYSVGWICAIAIELAAARAVLDETHPQLDVPDGDTNVYTFGRIGKHNVVIACLPEGRYGTAPAGIVAAHMRSSFKLRFGLMVGIGGGAPSEDNDIRLGDLVISQPTGVSGGVIQYDFGKAMENGEFMRTGFLNAPPSILLNAVASIKAMDHVELGKKIADSAEEIEEEDSRFQYPGHDADRLFRADYNHVAVAGGGRHRDTCKSCDNSKSVPRPERQYDHPYIHYGIIASGNQVMKDGIKRDMISSQTGALCFEMEAAGLMDDFSCLVIRGICDYSDGHKNKRWQSYSALTAAIYAKELLLQISTVSKVEPEDETKQQERIRELNLVIPFRMPFPRNRNFIGRAEELRKAYKYFAGSKPTGTPRLFALIGTGGMGKTQIALEYAYRHHKDYTAVFWVNAASEDTIRASFIDIMQCIIKEQARITWPESAPDYEAIGSRLGIPGLVDSKGILKAVDSETNNNIRSALFNWLQLPGNIKWLLIYDNADDLETFDMQEYLPNQGDGVIFITSRRSDFSNGAEQADLEGLDQESAITLLLSLARPSGTTEVQKKEAITLVDKLGYLPLAISQAGSYIHETKVPLGEYMSYYDEAFITVQSKKPRFGWNYRNDTAATTWEISFSHVEKQNKEAASLLLVCSYLNPGEIFDNLWENEKSTKFEIKERILLLASYSLIRILHFGVFSIHPVVQSWARERGDQIERFQALKQAVIIVGTASQQEKISRESSEWDAQEERRIASHAGYLHRYSKSSFSKFLLQERLESENISLFDYMLKIASVFHNQGNYDEAMQWYQRVLTGTEKTWGKDHPSTLFALNNISSCLTVQGRYNDAMQVLERTLAGSEKSFGPDHFLTLSALENMALCFDKQGKYDDAMQLFKRVFVSREKILGPDHLDTLNSVNNMALGFFNQDRYDEAEQWSQRAFTGYKRILGTDNPKTLTVIHNLAYAFENQNKADEAMQWNEQALAGREKILGANHPDTLDTVYNMARLFHRQGRCDEAAQWFERALTGREKILGIDHPHTLDILNNIAVLLDEQGKYDEAMQYWDRARVGKEKVLDRSHESIVCICNNMAIVSSKQGKYKEAVLWFEQVLAGREKLLGPDHLDTIDTINNIGAAFDQQGKYNEAGSWYERALAGKEKTLGESHPSTLSSVIDIAKVLFNQDRYSESLFLFERLLALEGEKTVLHEKYMDTLEIMNTIAGILRNRSMYDEAIIWFSRVLISCESTLGANHPSTLGTANDMALVLFNNLRKYDEAMIYFKRIFTSREEVLTADHPETLETVINIAAVHYKKCEYEDAMLWYERGFNGCKKVLGADHPYTLHTAECVQAVKRLSD